MDDVDDVPFLSKVEAEDAFFLYVEGNLAWSSVAKLNWSFVICSWRGRSFFLILNYCDFGGMGWKSTFECNLRFQHSASIRIGKHSRNLSDGLKLRRRMEDR